MTFLKHDGRSSVTNDISKSDRSLREISKCDGSVMTFLKCDGSLSVTNEISVRERSLSTRVIKFVSVTKFYISGIDTTYIEPRIFLALMHSNNYAKCCMNLYCEPALHINS